MTDQVSPKESKAALDAALKMVSVDAFEDITLILADHNTDHFKIVDQPRGELDAEEYSFGSIFVEQASESAGIICMPKKKEKFLQFNYWN